MLFTAWFSQSAAFWVQRSSHVLCCMCLDSWCASGVTHCSFFFAFELFWRNSLIETKIFTTGIILLICSCFLCSVFFDAVCIKVCSITDKIIMNTCVKALPQLCLLVLMISSLLQYCAVVRTVDECKPMQGLESGTFRCLILHQGVWPSVSCSLSCCNLPWTCLMLKLLGRSLSISYLPVPWDLTWAFVIFQCLVHLEFWLNFCLLRVRNSAFFVSCFFLILTLFNAFDSCGNFFVFDNWCYKGCRSSTCFIWPHPCSCGRSSVPFAHLHGYSCT